MTKIPYDKTQINSAYGRYDSTRKAGYILDNFDSLQAPWYFIYDNRELLLYVDQNGPVKVQYQPPNGIMVFKREMGENQSKWQVWVQSSVINGGVAVSNFGFPKLNCVGEKPTRTVKWYPEKAIYSSKYKNATIETEIFMPDKNATICMKTTITNTGDEKADFIINPAMSPYVNIPQMVAWDLPEWYLTTTVKKNGDFLVFSGQMKEPAMDKSKNRSVTLTIDYDGGAKIETDMTNYVGAGNFFCPESVTENKTLNIPMSEADGVVQSSYQAVYTAKYGVTLEKGQSKTFTQVLTVQKDLEYNHAEWEQDKVYFDDKAYAEKVDKTIEFYENLFKKRIVKTHNPIFDNFMNNYAPLQMHWISTLDRGWPSQQRGIRDTSQDCAGLLPLNECEVRKKILEVFEHQTSEGWFYKQMSTVSRSAPHDMRKFCDGGAFVIEMVNEYLAFTRDYSVLDEKVMWLDSDTPSTILEHFISCVQYYVDEKNIGEHGLCKAWHGDWYDIIDGIGLEGRGESVTVTAQTIINLRNVIKIIKWLNEKGKAKEYSKKIAEYKESLDKFIEAMGNALNSDGYYNGYFNDNGEWLLGNSDPDGQKKVYIVANAWAILSGCQSRETANRILDIIKKNNWSKVGYRIVSKPFAKYVDKAGRMGSLLLNGSGPYNHGDSFLVRASCAVGNAQMAYDVNRYILPIEEDYAPSDKTFAAPFAIANSYSNNEKYLHRVELQYLSGTVSYVLRNFYGSFCGINYDLYGLMIKPCLPEEFGDFSIEFTYLGKKFKVNYIASQQKSGQFSVNGKAHKGEMNEQSGKSYLFIPDCDMMTENQVEVWY